MIAHRDVDLPELDRRMQGVFALLFPHDGSDLAGHVAQCLREIQNATPDQWNKWSKSLLSIPGVYDSIASGGPEALLELFRRWIHARSRFTDALKRVPSSG